ncbi:methenyltetrahydromethanopterin cyclohydrolase [Ignisphaera sp. 4213-co]|uniref:Methenyltetrahydromethanopterin cyclohydrolase n=1 Tax=Ignisphaera cupida TaxID=3050454 RepID=A0ABD4Z8M6_9CREN|nr:methenyltetrahydromethanopterin cyclohydrolase [Ignisphaera sp. 4213-co]MDK6029250.1 methenyltetrahydromethanopterin cyclohydrolase [Ignisphaera sp. 4213-co]
MTSSHTFPKPMNKIAANIVSDAISREKELGIITTKIGGATVVDAGVKTRGSLEAGLIVSRICLGGLASVTLTGVQLDHVFLPAVQVSTDYPVESCMASQLAGWRIQVKDFFANGSGPARALARKPKKLFDYLGYSEQSDEAVLVLETDRYPSEDVVAYISSETKVLPQNLYLVLVSPASIAGSVQVSARIVETGIFKLHSIGYDIKTIRYGFGVCPVAPLHPDPLVMAGRTNDMLLYGGSTFYMVEFDDDEKLRGFVEKAPSLASKDYGKSFTELVKIYGWDFLYKVDPQIFAPAVIAVNNVKTGSIFKAGVINMEILRKALY